jgi:hypothetical protein
MVRVKNEQLIDIDIELKTKQLAINSEFKSKQLTLEKEKQLVLNAESDAKIPVLEKEKYDVKETKD